MPLPATDAGSVVVQVGHTPDADDAFMFYGLNSGRCLPAGLTLEHVLEPMQQLNRWSLEGRLEMTAMSFATYGQVAHLYRPISSGLSLGHGYGPLIVTRAGATEQDVRRGCMATPGELTSAHWLARLWNPEQRFLPTAFHATLDSVLEGRTDSALVIHEGQMTYAEQGLQLCDDLGRWWSEVSGGLPVPLGVNAVLRTSPHGGVLATALRDSIALALNEVDAAVDAALPLARGLDRERCREFVLRYVNDTTLDPGPSGLQAVEAFYQAGRKAGISDTMPPLDWLVP